MQIYTCSGQVYLIHDHYGLSHWLNRILRLSDHALSPCGLDSSQTLHAAQGFVAAHDSPIRLHKLTHWPSLRTISGAFIESRARSVTDYHGKANFKGLNVNAHSDPLRRDTQRRDLSHPFLPTSLPLRKLENKPALHAILICDMKGCWL
ncbi:hypothetical protein AB1N83_011816, partial [Pleurotus pulmonarius]